MTTWAPMRQASAVDRAEMCDMKEVASLRLGGIKNLFKKLI